MFEVCEVWGVNDDKIETEISLANARLIAAAPELLEALHDLLTRYVELVNCGDCGHWDPEQEDDVKAARAAIAKARGFA